MRGEQGLLVLDSYDLEWVKLWNTIVAVLQTDDLRSEVRLTH